MAKAEVEGIVNAGMYPFIKHFVLNEQEINRNAFLTTWSNEQAMREIYFKPFEDTSQVCYHTVDLLIFFYTHRKDRNLLFMTETYHIPFIGHYILIRSYCFHFGSSVSSPVLLLPIQFLCFQSVVYNWYSLDESVCRSGQETKDWK